ncbi:hypothetical protein K470DRAFT_254759 [Piedraia hortae CBS 480.64]|uniref:Uncharacterized protein n=1 Tax=Piedraia hortae CBS 480.64 TaxID=1314780 RepID=A0A6A7CA55_9PEZI|nr:hypothetical protein K470DRAFT_254759 [Piedraia hortae CBS 480.64]
MTKEHSVHGWIKKSKLAIRSYLHPEPSDAVPDTAQPSTHVVPQTVQPSLKDAKDLGQLRDLVLEKLNEAERRVLLSKLDSDGDGTEDLEVIMENTKALSNNAKLKDNRALNLIKKFRSSLAWLHNYRDSGQALVSMQPMPAAGVWAGINALIVVSSNQLLLLNLSNVLFPDCGPS